MKTAASTLLSILGLAGVSYCELAQGQAVGEIISRMTWEGNHHEYVLVSFPDATWEAVQNDLSELLPGAYLATLAEAEENDVVTEFRLQFDEVPGQVWLGGIQLPPDEPGPDVGWRWVTGEVWNGTHWCDSEPDDGDFGENHLALQGECWGDAGSATDNIGGYLAERDVLLIRDGFEGRCPCFAYEDARDVATHPFYTLCWDYSMDTSEMWLTSHNGIQSQGDISVDGSIQNSEIVYSLEFGILPSERLMCGWSVKNVPAGIDETVSWSGDPRDPMDRRNFQNCQSVIERVVTEQERVCETSPECEKRIVIDDLQIDELTVTVNGSLINAPPENCVNNKSIDSVEWYWGDGAMDTFDKMPDGFVYPFPNSHTYTELSSQVIRIYAFDIDGKIIGSKSRMLRMFPQ